MKCSTAHLEAEVVHECESMEAKVHRDLQCHSTTIIMEVHIVAEGSSDTLRIPRRQIS